MIQRTNDDATKAAISIAASMLKQKGELSLSDIQAIPFLSNSHQVEDVVEYLVNHLHGRIYQKKVSSRPISRWEQIIELRDWDYGAS